MRLNGLIAVLSIPLLGGFVPINNYRAAVDTARAACSKLMGKNIRTDLAWFGSAPGPFDKNPGHHWQLYALKQGDDGGPGPKHWYFKVDLPPSGAGPNTCIKNDALPASELLAPIPPGPKPQPLAPKHNV
jgi:hypothetical protein